jgi:hypothetical protein
MGTAVTQIHKFPIKTKNKKIFKYRICKIQQRSKCLPECETKLIPLVNNPELTPLFNEPYFIVDGGRHRA